MSTPDYDLAAQYAVQTGIYAATAASRQSCTGNAGHSGESVTRYLAKTAAALGYVLTPMMTDPPRSTAQVSASLAGAAFASANVAPASEDAA